MRRQEAIEDKALDWLIRRNGPDWTADKQAGLEAWLEESMAHKAAFWRAEHGWQQADRIRSIGFDNDDRVDATGRQRKWWQQAAIAASLVATVTAGGLTLFPHSLVGPAAPVRTIQQMRVATPIGGRKIVPLVDGSKVELNTRTVLRTAVTKGRREVWLDSGEAFFEVAHRDGDPFVVHAGRQTITVMGTKFSVRRDVDRVTVNVLEGRVKVQDGQDAEGHAAIITAGDTAIARGASTLIAVRSQKRVEDALAWRDGMLSFDQAPLSTVAAEFNRYNRTRIVVADEAAAQMPIGGAFQASSVDSFTRLLHDAYGLSVEYDDDIVKISSPSRYPMRRL